MSNVILVRGVDTPIDDNGQFVARRDNRWATRVGYWSGRGYNSTDVAVLAGENTSAGTVKGMLRRAGVLPVNPGHPIIPVELPYWQRDIICRHAADRGLTLQQIIQQVLESALVFDDLYDAVTDGRYDQ